MAHFITEVDETAWTGERPWHGLGVEVPGLMKTGEAMRLAKLHWTVAKVPMVTAGTWDMVSRRQVNGKLCVPDFVATVREDTKKVLGVVSCQYEVFQNWQMFDFVDALLQERLAVVEVCGSLHRGRYVWALMRLPGHIRVRNTDDISAKYLLLVNSHDGSTAFRALFTAIRVVCWNTLSLAMQSGARQGVTLRHRGDMAARVDEARAVLGIANSHYDKAGEEIDGLAEYEPSEKDVREFLAKLFPLNDEAGEEQRRIVSGQHTLFPPNGVVSDRWRRIVLNQRHRVRELFESGMGQDMPGVRRSAWALVNAVTEYVDWRENAPRLKGFEVGESRLYSAWFGAGALLKERAFRQALALATSKG